MDHGELRRDNGEWHAAPAALGNLSFTPSIQAILAARLERLGRAERLVIEAASVIGKEFYDVPSSRSSKARTST